MSRSNFFDAIRILFIFCAGGTPLKNDKLFYSEFKGETKLMAYDFWVRYPDYFAHELHEKYEETGEFFYKEKAESIIADAEPNERQIPMIRYLFGAYEKPDNALAILKSRNLIQIKKHKLPNGHSETDFFITHRGYALYQKAVADWPVLRWYEERAKLVAQVAGDRGGDALKKRQYEQRVYAETKRGEFIPPLQIESGLHEFKS